MMTRLSIIITILGIVVSCGFEENRIELIAEKSGIELPSKFEVLRNESVDGGSIDGDYSIYIELKFDMENFEKLKANIRKGNGLGEWTRYQSGQKFTGNDAYEPTTIEIDNNKRTLEFEMHHI